MIRGHAHTIINDLVWEDVTTPRPKAGFFVFVKKPKPGGRASTPLVTSVTLVTRTHSPPLRGVFFVRQINEL